MAQKRTVSFADNVTQGKFSDSTGDDFGEYDPPEKEEVDESGEPPEKQKKHTLDSDEEEDDEVKKTDIDKVDGVEDTDLDYDGDIKITGFNMKDEEEEGYFDEDQNFVFHKKEKDSKDAWLDNIDWTMVKQKAGEQWEGDKEKGDDDDDEIAPASLNDIRRKEIFTSLLSFLKKEQTIAKALTELKKKKGLSAAEERKLRWAAKRAGKVYEETTGDQEAKTLSGLADELISNGHMDAYEWTKEKIEFQMQRMDSAAVDSLDMFADAPATSTSTANAPPEDDEVKWEYKENEEGTVEGPFTSLQMSSKQESGQLAAKGLARKVGAPSFNPVSRIDFDLYC